MRNTEFILAAWRPPGLVDGPHRIRERALQELTSLGLTHEASLGILRVLLRRGGPNSTLPSAS